MSNQSDLPENIFYMRKSGFGLRSIKSGVAKIIKPAINKRKDDFLIINNLRQNWANFIGQRFYLLCSPKKIKFARGRKNNGVLYVSAYNPTIAFYIEANSKDIIEKIASYYGYKIIQEIKIIQELRNIKIDGNNPLKKDQITNDQQNSIKNNIKDIKDQDLKDILQKLGESIITKNS